MHVATKPCSCEVYQEAAYLQLRVPKRLLEAPQRDAPHHISGRQRCSGQLPDVVKLDAAGQTTQHPQQQEQTSQHFTVRAM
jgi:hypothetical protein